VADLTFDHLIDFVAVPEGGARPLHEIIEQLAATGLFDASFYLLRNPDVAVSGLDPLRHFCQWGWREGRWPNPIFDPSWYLAQNPEVAAFAINPLLHYALVGEPGGRRPAPNFDPRALRLQYELAPGDSPLRHALRAATGAPPPPPGFDPDWYLVSNPDVAESGMDPFEHYHRFGAAEGRTPRPDNLIIGPSGLFDTAFYEITAADDLIDCEITPLVHFCLLGWADGRRPNPYFDTGWYLHTHMGHYGRPHVPHPLNPVTHYILYGEAQNLRPVPYFDVEWYRQTYRLPPDHSPLRHYLANRRTQQFSPTPWFDPVFYVQNYGHLVGPNRDPFAHYLRHGATLDLLPSTRFDPVDYRKRHMRRSSRYFGHRMPVARQHPLVHFLASEYAGERPAL
jgi:hypothetical protein